MITLLAISPSPIIYHHCTVILVVKLATEHGFGAHSGANPCQYSLLDSHA